MTCRWEGHFASIDTHGFCGVCQEGTLMCVNCSEEEAAYNDDVCKGCRAQQDKDDEAENKYMEEKYERMYH